MSSRR